MFRRRQVVPDEAFAIRDSQFDYPHIGILPHSAVQIVLKFLFIVRYLSLRNTPFAASIEVWHAFVQDAKRLIFHDNNQDRAAVALALVEDHGETALGLDHADESVDFEVRGQARIHRPIRHPAEQPSAARRPAL